MRALVFVLVVLAVVNAATPLKSKEALLAAYNAAAAAANQAYSPPDDTIRYSPVVANQLDKMFYKEKVLNTLHGISDEVGQMTNQLYYPNNPIAPRQRPALQPLLKDVVKSLKKVQKRTTKQGDLPRAKENMEMFTRLLDSVKNINKRLDPKPAELTNQQRTLRNNQIQKMLYIPQPQEETEEQQAMHARSHAQTQMLHRLTHAIDRLAVNTQEDFDRKVKYDRVLNDMMHQHLANPVFHDDMHDHLLAHHLTTPHSDDQYNEHLAQHMLYHDVGRNAESEYLHSTPRQPVMSSASSSVPVSDVQQQRLAAVQTNHLYDAAQQREISRHNMANTFAQESYDRFKDLKPIA